MQTVLFSCCYEELANAGFSSHQLDLHVRCSKEAFHIWNTLDEGEGMEVTFSPQSKHHFREQHSEGMLTTQFLTFSPVSHSLASYFTLLKYLAAFRFPQIYGSSPCCIFFPRLFGFKGSWKEFSSCYRGHMSI